MSVSSTVDPSSINGQTIAVLIPCFNEAPTIRGVVHGFRAALPSAKIYVYDNNSTDRTADIAGEAGAVVRSERRQGKGNVVRRMLADIDADIYILVDGDGTYNSSASPVLVRLLIDRELDLVNAARRATAAGAYQFGHQFGNVILTRMVQFLFGREFTDMLSGYKVMSRRFVKSFPAMSTGFETETELAVHALELRVPSEEIQLNYGERALGSTSKLRTYRDGFRIILLILRLVKDERPLSFFSLISGGLVASSMVLIAPVVATFIETGLVPRLPTAILESRVNHFGFTELFYRFDARHDDQNAARAETTGVSFIS